MGQGARICPRCATRVDERRAKTSPYCLRCGAPLGTPPPTFAGKAAGGGSSPLPWILGGIGAFVLLGLIGAVVVVVAISQAEDPVRPAATVVGGGQPNVETPSTATATVATPVTAATSAPAVKATAPTATPTFVTRPPVTVTPPTPTPPATNTNLPLGAFPRAKALNELDRVTATLASCKRAGDPTGAGTIRVDFEPDGRVGTLSRKPFSGTPTGSCISARFLAIRVGKFDGTTQQIERTFTIP